MIKLIGELSDGNDGAAKVCFDILKTFRDKGDKVESLLLYLKEMGLKGASIWRAYKDWAGCDLDKFAQGVLDDDQSMLNVALQIEPPEDRDSMFEEKVITHVARTYQNLSVDAKLAESPAVIKKRIEKEYRDTHNS